MEGVDGWMDGLGRVEVPSLLDKKIGARSSSNLVYLQDSWWGSVERSLIKRPKVINVAN